MNKVSKLLPSLVMAGSILALTSGAAQAVTLSWHDVPIMGTSVTPGPTLDPSSSAYAKLFTVTETSGSYTLPDSGTRPSQFIFPIDGSTYVLSASSVNIDVSSTYRYASNMEYFGTGGTGPYSFPIDWIGIIGSDIWSPAGYSIAQLWGGYPGYGYPDYTTSDVGVWKYTETWTGIAGPDSGAVLTGSRYLCMEVTTGSCEGAAVAGFVDARGSGVGVPSSVPEPATLALLGLGLVGLGFSQRRKQV